MAKKEYNKYAKAKRIRAYESCIQCNGSPPVKECNLQGLKFNICDLCMELVGDYKKEGPLIKVKEIPSTYKHINVDESTSEVKPTYSETIVIKPEGEIIPGVLKLSNLFKQKEDGIS